MTLNFEAEVNVPFDFDVEALAGEVINFTLDTKISHMNLR